MKSVINPAIRSHKHRHTLQYLSAQTHTHISSHSRVLSCPHTHARSRTYTQTNTCTKAHAHTRVCAHAHTATYSRKLPYIYKHTLKTPRQRYARINARKLIQEMSTFTPVHYVTIKNYMLCTGVFSLCRCVYYRVFACVRTYAHKYVLFEYKISHSCSSSIHRTKKTVTGC